MLNILCKNNAFTMVFTCCLAFHHYLYNLSRNLAENHELFAFEVFNIAGMVKKHHLAKSIADASCNRIIQYTMYKAESAGTFTVLIDPKIHRRNALIVET
jgi:transposase